MKRLLIIISFIVLTCFGYVIIANGFSNDQFGLDISSYSDIENDSAEMTKLLAAYNKKNDEEYETTLTSLKGAITKYKKSKQEYEDVLKLLEEQMGTNEEGIHSSKVSYEIEFLLAELGLYGDRNGLDIEMTLSKSNAYDENASSLGYTLCDMNFKLVGEYIDIAEYLYDIEGNDELGFEIRDFNMIPTQTSFTVYSVPIKSSSLIESVTNSSLNDPNNKGSMTGVVNDDGSPVNTTTNNTTNSTSGNTTNNTTTNTSTNTNTTNTASNSGTTANMSNSTFRSST